MAKPIFTAGIPSCVVDSGSISLHEIQDALDKKFGSDYFVFVYPASGDDFEFEVFYEKDFNEVKYEEFKKFILNKTKTQ